MAAMRRNRNKTPKIFYVFYVVAAIIAIAIAVMIPFPLPGKIMTGMLLEVGLSFLAVYVYAKYIRK